MLRDFWGFWSLSNHATGQVHVVPPTQIGDVGATVLGAPGETVRVWELAGHEVGRPPGRRIMLHMLQKQITIPNQNPLNLLVWPLQALALMQ